MPDDTDRPGAVVGDSLDAEISPPHPGGSDSAQPHEKRGRSPRRDRYDAAVVPAVFVAEGKRKQEVSDRSNALLRETGRTRRPQARNPRDRITKGQRRLAPSGRAGGRLLYAERLQSSAALPVGSGDRTLIQRPVR